MTRNQLFILAGVIATFVVMVLFWETLWPLLILMVVGGGLALIGSKTNLLKKIFPDKSINEEHLDTKNITWDTRSFTVKSLIVIFTIGGIVWVILLAFSEPVTNAAGDVTFSWASLWFWTVIAYAIFSYRFWSPVPTGEQAALTYFGRPIANVEAGPPYAPLFVVNVLTITAQTPQREFPAEPELIDRTELKDGYIIPDNKRPPLRIQFRDSITNKQAEALFGKEFYAKRKLSAEEEEKLKEETKPEEEMTEEEKEKLKGIPFVAEVPTDATSAAQAAADGLSRRVTAEVQHVARIRVDNPSLFFTNVPSGPSKDPIEEAFRQIEDEMVKILTQFFTRMSVAQALMNIRWISIHLQNAVDERVGAKGDRRSWGVDVQAAFVKLIHTDHGINIAISEAAQAPFKKSKTIIDAEAEQKKRELEGRGAAIAAQDLEKRTLEGRAAGLKKLATQINVTGAEAQAAEVARSIGDGGNTVVVGTEGFGQLAGIAAAALGKPKKEPTQKTEEPKADKETDDKKDTATDTEGENS